jgi:hypothetical protein
VNWVKALQDICANMTQYRVNARNCEAKRLHIVRYVACEFAHVCLARQRARDERRWYVTPKLRLLEPSLPAAAEAARGPVPAQAGVRRPYYGKLRPIPMSVARAVGLWGQRRLSADDRYPPVFFA